MIFQNTNTIVPANIYSVKSLKVKPCCNNQIMIPQMTDLQNSNTFTIESIPYYDRFNKCYQKILTVNQIPNGPLAQLVNHIQYPKLSPFQQDSACYVHPKCVYSIEIDNYCMPIEHRIQNLTGFLLSNGYQIETQITNLYNNMDPKRKIVYTVTYYGENAPQIVYTR